MAGGGKKGGVADSFLITSAEGKLQLVGKGGRLEKPVDAHRFVIYLTCNLPACLLRGVRFEYRFIQQRHT